MHISLTGFVSDLQDYLAAHPGVAGGGAQSSLRALGECTFENAEEARLTLTDFVQTIQKSGKPELREVIQGLFAREIQRLLSTPPAEEPAAELTRLEPANAETGIQNLDQVTLAHIFSFLDRQSQGRAGRVSRVWHDAMQLQRLFDLDPLHSPEFTPLLSLFGITLPPPNPSPSDVSAAWKALFEKVLHVLEGIKKSKALSDEEKKSFRAMKPQDIVQDPTLLYTLLHTAHEISLVSPFLNGRNAGPELPSEMTLTEKAEAVRKHLKEKGDTYEELECDDAGTLCFPREFCSLQNLRFLDLTRNSLTTLPPEIEQLKQLRGLWVRDNQLTSLPHEIGQLALLQTLWLSHNQLTTLPPEIEQLKQLRGLWVSHNHLSSLPHEIGQLARLQKLDIGNNQLSSLPHEIGQLKQLQELMVYHNQLTSLPHEIGQLALLQQLVVDNNQLTSLPHEIGQLKQLHMLVLSQNQLTSLPHEIGQLARLQKLDIGNNQLTYLPPEIGQLALLQELWVDHNQLTSLPAEIMRLAQEIYIHLGNNHLTVIPKSTKNIHIINE
jgi:Leucine-rich repeat (LRR) protein